jgi:levansucrase
MGCALNLTDVKEKMSVWAVGHVEQIARQVVSAIPIITSATPILPGYDLWDMWPVQLPGGATADFDGMTLWMLLCAPSSVDPGERHAIARIRMMSKRGDVWIDCGNVMPDGFSPGSREWAGSACFDSASKLITLYFTAAGRRGADASTFEQRIFAATGNLTVTDSRASISFLREPVECFVSDDDDYVLVNQAEGEPGHIKAFRDPAYFCDPADGAEYLLFTGSLKKSENAFNGAIGLAQRSATGWTLLPPLVSADGLNNELERPHIVVKDGQYYLFWSTQRRVFAPGGPDGPNGLYGMVASSLFGPYTPLNGTGLVAANPAAEPLQAYSWWVLGDLNVVSFVDHWGLAGRSFEEHPELLRQQFGGTPAPLFSLQLEGDRAMIAETKGQ